MTRNYFHSGRGAFPLFLCSLASLFLAGCNTEPPVPEGGIRVVDPGPMGEATARPTTEPVDWLSRRTTVRLSHPVEELWALTDETILSEVSRAVWNGNGMRVGLLSAGQADEFGEALGKTFEVRDTHIRSFDEPRLLRRSPPLRAEFFADLTVPPLPVTKEYFTRGRLQLLMSSRPRGDGSALLTLLPQHHMPRSNFVPRTAAEKLLDGRIYNELGIEVNVGPSEALLIGFYQPPPPAPDESTPKSNVSPEAQDASNPENLPAPPATPGAEESPPPQTTVQFEAEDAEGETPAAETPDLPLNLGRGLFTTGVRDRDLQILFLLRPLP